MARRQARVEDGPRDAVVRVGVDAGAGLGGLRPLEGPGAPVADAGAGLRGFVGHGVGGVGVGGAGAGGRREVAGGGDAGGRDEVGGGRRGGVDGGGGGVGDVGEPDGEVVAVDEREVDVVLRGRDAAGEVEFCEGGGGVALGGVLVMGPPLSCLFNVRGWTSHIWIGSLR